MKVFEGKEVWFITGSQHLYGEETLRNVDHHAKEIAAFLDGHKDVPVTVRSKGVVTTPDEITGVLAEVNAADACIGVVLWMHTFSPAKMWINGLKALRKPMLHFHTQFNEEIPWSEIDMDFMNENQSAHGGREFGFMVSRMQGRRKVIVGHWKNPKVVCQLATWIRVAAAWDELQHMKVARIGDNMREVAVTEGDKVAAQMVFGFSVNGYGVGDLEKYIDHVPESDISRLVDEYAGSYKMKENVRSSHSIRDAAQIEIGLRAFLDDGGFTAFTDTFENLGRLKQLPGIAVQRLMADGYGFAAEGDWKTAALLRAVKTMEKGIRGGTSFMEDYTYDFHREGRSRVLGSHMLEICPSIADGKISCEVHPLSIGGKEDPARLVFGVDTGPAINVSLIDMGNRFRLLVNEVEVVKPKHKLPKLPVARVLWDPKPDLETAARAWVLGGGAHHTVFSKSVTTEFMEDFAEIAGVELLVIDDDTTTRNFKDRIRWNQVYYHLFS